MTAFIVLRYLHFLALSVLFGLLVAQHLKVKKQMSPDEIRRVMFIDAGYGIAALVVFSMGLCLWLWVGKPAEFYSANPVFHAKLGLFLVMALLSVYPAITFIRLRLSSRGSDQMVTVPKPVIGVIRAELILFLCIPLLAVIMAQGQGLSS